MVGLLGRTKLLHAASVHSYHALSQRHGLNRVVRSEERCDAEFDVQLLNIMVSLHAQLGVQNIQGFVKKPLRLVLDGTTHRHAPALTAVELARFAD